jgi:hypothetical protein
MMEPVEGRENEGEYYREIVRRSKRVRERAAETLKRAREARKRQPDRSGDREASGRRRKLRPQD